MVNNKHEGWPGFPIGPVGDKGKADFADRPSVILLMAGTNDIVFDFSPSKAPQALSRVIGNIIEGCPGATLLVATIPPLLRPELAKKVLDFNGALPAVVKMYAGKGNKIALVDTKGVKPEHIHSDDGIHPNDSGYKIIAQAWYDSIVLAGRSGWIEAPRDRNASTAPKTEADGTGVDAIAMEKMMATKASPFSSSVAEIGSEQKTKPVTQSDTKPVSYEQHVGSKAQPHAESRVSQTLDMIWSSGSRLLFYGFVAFFLAVTAWYVAKMIMMRRWSYYPLPQS